MNRKATAGYKEGKRGQVGGIFSKARLYATQRKNKWLASFEILTEASRLIANGYRSNCVRCVIRRCATQIRLAQALGKQARLHKSPLREMCMEKGKVVGYVDFTL